MPLSQSTVDQLLDRARSLVPQSRPGHVLPAKEAAGALVADRALAALEDRRGRLTQAANGQLLRSMAYLALGDDDKAALAFLAQHATPLDLIRAGMEGGTGLVASKDDLEDTKRLMKEIGSAVAKDVLPILVAAALSL